LSDVNGPVDVCVVFRSPDECVDVAKEAVEAKDKLGLKVLWMQSGIVNDEAAKIAKAGGLECVMDKCVSEEVAAKQGKHHDREDSSHAKASDNRNRRQALGNEWKNERSGKSDTSARRSESGDRAELAEGLGESHSTKNWKQDTNSKPFDASVHGRGEGERLSKSSSGSVHAQDQGGEQFDVSSPYGSVRASSTMDRPYKGAQDFTDESLGESTVQREQWQSQSDRDFQEHASSSSQASPPDDKWKYKTSKDQSLKQDPKAHEAWQKGNYANPSGGSQSRVDGKPQTFQDVNKKQAVPSENKGRESSTGPLTPGAQVTPASGEQQRRAFHSAAFLFTQHTATTSTGAPRKVGESQFKKDPLTVEDPDLKQPSGAFQKAYSAADATRTGQRRSGLDASGEEAYPSTADPAVNQQFVSGEGEGDRHYRTDNKGPGAKHNVQTQRRRDSDPPVVETEQQPQGLSPESPRGFGAKSGSGMFHEARDTKETDSAHQAEQSMRHARNDEGEPTSGAQKHEDRYSPEQQHISKHHHRVGRRDVDDLDKLHTSSSIDEDADSLRYDQAKRDQNRSAGQRGSQQYKDQQQQQSVATSSGMFQRDKQSEDTLHQGP